MKNNVQKYSLWLLLLFIIICIGTNSFYINTKPKITASDDNVIFNKLNKPVFRGQYKVIAGDPSVIREGNILLMAYTCYDAYRSPQGTALCSAKSNNGINWEYTNKNGKTWGRIAAASDKDWDMAQETSFLLKDKDSNRYLLYYVGYNEAGFFINGADIGLAVSQDGNTFMRHEKPILERGQEGSLDSFGITSPSVVQTPEGFHMIYVGWCMKNCRNKTMTNIMYAFSKDGVRWQKRKQSLLDFTATPFSAGVAEPELILGPDKTWYIFFSSTGSRHVIGIARSQNLEGPWEIRKEPLFNISDSGFDADGVVAPSVIIEDGKVRMWFNAQREKQINIGYAEASWPLNW